jgi:hypothetical protein
MGSPSPRPKYRTIVVNYDRATIVTDAVMSPDIEVRRHHAPSPEGDGATQPSILALVIAYYAIASAAKTWRKERAKRYRSERYH